MVCAITLYSHLSAVKYLVARLTFIIIQLSSQLSGNMCLHIVHSVGTQVRKLQRRLHKLWQDCLVAEWVQEFESRVQNQVGISVWLLISHMCFELFKIDSLTFTSLNNP